MGSRRPGHDDIAEVARRRLEQLSAELASIRPPLADQGTEPEHLHLHRQDLPWLSPQQSGRSEQPGHPAPLGAAGSTTWSPPPGRHAHRSVGPVPRVAGWVHDRLPPSLQGRGRMTMSHLVVVALLVVAGIAVSLWWVARADGETTLVTAAGRPTPSGGGALVTPSVSPKAAPSTLARSGASAATTGGGAAAVPESPGATVGSIVVDVAGRVRRPGIATLPSGSRVVDAVEAAGGARRGASLRGLNLARVLTDGEQVLVGAPAPGGVAAAAAAAVPGSGAAVPTALVPLNTATEAQLEELPGIGPVTAASILDYRAENGPFSSVDELLEVSGIGDATLADLAPFVTL